MKLRVGFVSNSSSTSFIISKKNLDWEQVSNLQSNMDFYQNLLCPNNTSQDDIVNKLLQIPKDIYWEFGFQENDDFISLISSENPFPIGAVLKMNGIKNEDILEIGGYGTYSIFEECNTLLSYFKNEGSLIGNKPIDVMVDYILKHITMDKRYSSDEIPENDRITNDEAHEYLFDDYVLLNIPDEIKNKIESWKETW